MKLIGPSLLLALWLPGMRDLHAAPASTPAPPAPASATAARPNILFALADDWSFPHAGAYGCSWARTPAFDRVARDGVLFTQAYTPNAKCAPSRSTILTGRNPWQLRAACNHIPFFPPEFKTYAEALGEHGYFVGMTAKGWAPGVATNALGQPRAMAGRPFNRRTAPPPTSGIGRNDYAANFAEFLDAARPGQPWCFWYGSTEPHRGYEYGSGARLGGRQPGEVDRVPGCWPDNPVVRNDLLDYAFEVEHFDRHLGRMLEELERRGQLGRTLVLVTADNGMPFPRAKGQSYELANHLPLAAMWPEGIRAPGRVVDDPVSFVDFAPTFLEVAGLPWAESGLAPSPGRSLTDLFHAPRGGRVNPARQFVLLGRERTDVGRPHDWGYPIRGLVQDGWLYLHNFEPARWPGGNPETGYLDCDGGPTKTEVLQGRRQKGERRFWDACFGKRPSEELYDLRRDPDCLESLAAHPDCVGRAAEYKARLFGALKAQDDPRMHGQGAVFEAYPYAHAAERNFYERFLRGEPVKAGWVNSTDFEKEPVE